MSDTTERRILHSLAAYKHLARQEGGQTVHTGILDELASKGKSDSLWAYKEALAANHPELHFKLMARLAAEGKAPPDGVRTPRLEDEPGHETADKHDGHSIHMTLSFGETTFRHTMHPLDLIDVLGWYDEDDEGIEDLGTGETDDGIRMCEAVSVRQLRLFVRSCQETNEAYARAPDLAGSHATGTGEESERQRHLSIADSQRRQADAQERTATALEGLENNVDSIERLLRTCISTHRDALKVWHESFSSNDY